MSFIKVVLAVFVICPNHCLKILFGRFAALARRQDVKDELAWLVSDGIS